MKSSSRKLEPDFSPFSPNELERVSLLAYDKLGIPEPPHAAWEPQYCTTNKVFASSTLVFKQYQRRSAFLIETQILTLSDYFSFRIPEIVMSLDSPASGCWNVFHRIPGITLLNQPIRKGAMQESVVDRLVDALVEFEDLARTLVDTEWDPWCWSSGIKPLVEFCSHHRANRAADILLQEAQNWDRQLESVPRVPCFDLYPRNIIWSMSGSQVVLSFVDFDKANRLVPRAEQLSHLAMIPEMQRAFSRGVKRYADLTSMDAKYAGMVANVALFFRALSGVRDSLPWSLFPARSSVDPHAAIRRRAFVQSMEMARKQTRVLAGESVGRSLRQEILDAALSEIVEVVRSKA